MTGVCRRRSRPAALLGSAILLSSLLAGGLCGEWGGGQAAADEPGRLAPRDGASAEEAGGPNEESAPAAGSAEVAGKKEEEDARAARRAESRARIAALRAQHEAILAEKKARAAMTPEERRTDLRKRRAEFLKMVEEKRREMEARFPQFARPLPPSRKARPAKPDPSPAAGAAAAAQAALSEPPATSQPVVPPPAYSASESEIATRRLAILTPPDLQRAGYSDLLTMKLTERLGEHLELVERDAIEQVMGEYQLSQLFGGAKAVEERISLGRILRADVLLLLSPEASDSADGDSASSVRSLLVDTGTGARLALDAFSDAAGVDPTTDAILAQAEDMLHRYPHGVERIVGVSHFLSRCLTHAYDGYQTSCAAILSESLARRRGVAVLELEEARAIGDELAITLSDRERAGDANVLHRRVVPILVSGEFRATQTAAGAQFEITASIQRTGKTPENAGEQGLDSEGLRVFLSETLPGVVRGESPDENLFRAKGHSVDAQFAWLCAEAERFDKIGLWEQAAGLREAALLLKPDDVDVRYALIRDYEHQMARPFPLPQRAADMPAEEAIRAEYRSRIPFYKRMVAHMEYLIRNGLVTQEDVLAAGTYGALAPAKNRLPIGNIMGAACERVVPRKMRFEEYNDKHRDYFLERRFWEIAREEFAVCYETERYFLERVFPLIRRLPTNHRKEMQLLFANKRIDLLLSPQCYGHLSDSERLAHLEKALTVDMPRDAGLCVKFFARTQSRASNFRDLWRNAKQKGDDADAVVRNDPWYQFMLRLADSRREDTQFYGRAGKNEIDLTVWEEKWRQAARDFRPEAKALGLERIGQYGPVLAEKLPAIREELDSIEKEFRQLESLGRERSWLPMPGGYSVASSIRRIGTIRRTELERPVPRDDKPGMVQPVFRPGPEHWPRYQLTEPIPYMVKTLDGQHRPVIDDDWPRLHRRWEPNYRWSIDTRYYPVVCWRRCGPQMDVLFSDWAILVMKVKGLAEEIHSDKDAHYLDVRSDGENLWVVTKNKGLWIMSTSGKILRTIDPSDGLPPYDARDVLEPFAPGKALMVGAFDRPIRSWCAIIDTSNERCVNVFHEATARHVRERKLAPEPTLECGFMPKYIISHKTGEQGPTYFVVAKQDSLPPMLINGDTLEVSEPAYVSNNPTAHEWNVLNWNNMNRKRHESDCLFYSLPGDRLLVPKCRIYQEYQSNKKPPVVEIWQSPFPNLDKKIEYTTHCIGAAGGRVFPVGKWLYISGNPMIRIDPQTLAEQKVYKDPGSAKTGGSIWQSSAHYGIVVGENRNDTMQHILPFRQVKILETPEAAAVAE